MKSMLEHALEYAREGWAVFPVSSIKEPLNPHGASEATTDLKQVEAWWTKWPQANIACEPWSIGAIVLDSDPGYSERELEQNIGALPKTELAAETPRGGTHRWFELHQGDQPIANSTSRLARHVDVRCFHGYVLLPPSRTIATPDGRCAAGEYKWKCADWKKAKMGFRTDKMYLLASTAKERNPHYDTWIIDPDMPENIAACVKWLEQDAQIATMGQGGELMAYRTATMCKSYGVSLDMARNLIWTHWNPRCNPPWGPDEIDHLNARIDRGYEYNTSPPGNMTSAYRVAKAAEMFKPVAKAVVEGEEGNEWTAGRFRFVDRAGLSFISPPEWLIPGLLPVGGYGLLYADPGSYKTFLALHWSLSIAMDAGWHAAESSWEIDPSKRGDVLYSLAEGRDGFGKRVLAWEKHQNDGEHISRFVLGDPVPSIGENLTPFIQGALAARPNGYKLCVIDTVGRAMQGFNENSFEHVSKFTAMVEKLQRELGCAVLALHHSGHNDKGRGQGSTEFGRAADATFGLEKESAFTVRLTNSKQKDSEPNQPLVLTMKEIQINDKLKSLVCTGAASKLSQHDTPRDQNSKSMFSARSKNDPNRNSAAVLANIDELVCEALKANPPKTWSTSEVAQAIALKAGIASKTLQQTQLVTLREAATAECSKHYEPVLKRWRWKG